MKATAHLRYYNTKLSGPTNHLAQSAIGNSDEISIEGSVETAWGIVSGYWDSRSGGWGELRFVYNERRYTCIIRGEHTVRTIAVIARRFARQVMEEHGI